MTRRLRRFLMPAPLLVLAAAALFGTDQKPQTENAKDKAGRPQAPAEVALTSPSPRKDGSFVAVKGDVMRRLAITGELKAGRSVEIATPRIRSVFSSMITYLAPEGEQIKKGDRLVEFDTSGLISQKSEIERRLAEAKLKIDKQKVDLEAQRCDLLNGVAQAEASLSVAVLYAKIPKDLQPANTFQQYQVNLDKAKLALQKAKEQMANFQGSYQSNMRLVEINLEQAELDMKKMDNDLAQLTIAAPQDGIVIYGDNWASNRKVQVGDNVFPGQAVVTLPDLSTLQVVGYVYDTELGFLKRGMQCGFGLDPLPGSYFAGMIVSLTSVAGRKGFASQQKVFMAVIQPDKVDLSLMKPGMTAHVEVTLKLASGVVIAPREFVALDTSRRCYVLRRKDPKTVSKQEVEVGVFGDRVVQLVSGVDEGDVLLPVQQNRQQGEE